MGDIVFMSVARLGRRCFAARSFAGITDIKLALSLGIAPRTSASRRAACRTNYTFFESILASVAGLAPAKANLKGWTLELLCIHGQKWMAIERKDKVADFTGPALTLSFCPSMALRTR